MFQTGSFVKIQSRTSEPPTLGFVREQVRRLFANLPGAQAGKEEPIHQVRVAARRLRVALPVASVKPSGRRVRRALKKLRRLTRLAGEGRDLDVAAGLLANEAPRAGQADSVVVELTRRLQTARVRAQRHLAQGLAEFDIARLRTSLDAILARGGAEPADAKLTLAAARTRQARMALAELQTLGSRFDPVALHTIRRRIRRLRYLAELQRALWKSRPPSIRILKQLQEVLGELHDASVLADWITKVAASWQTRGKASEAAGARTIAGRLHDRARDRHRRFLAAQMVKPLHVVLATPSKAPL